MGFGGLDHHRGGREELWPSSDEGWAAVAAGADRIAEISRVLAAPDYAEGLAQWAEISAQLEIIARTAKRDAERHDKAGLFDSGRHLYQVCVACHERHMIGEPELE
jgi:mono/diheme cytochrome c family protein